MKVPDFTCDEIWALRRKAQLNVREDGSPAINQALHRLSTAADDLRTFYPKEFIPPTDAPRTSSDASELKLFRETWQKTLKILHTQVSNHRKVSVLLSIAGNHADALEEMATEGSREETKPAPKEKPPLGLKPRRLYDIYRIQDIIDAMARYHSAHKVIPPEWPHELWEIVVNSRD